MIEPQYSTGDAAEKEARRAAAATRALAEAAARRAAIPPVRLPPEVGGEEAGDDEPEGCGIDGGDGIDGLCVEVLVAQPASPSAQATGQTNALTMTSRMLSGLLGFAQRQGARRGL